MEKIIKYYASYDEEGRLARDNAHKLEFVTTVHTMDQLIQPENSILDVGAGTGRYSFYYADKGNQVTAFELVEKHVEIMQAKCVLRKDPTNPQVYQGDGRDLSVFTDNSFDVVLCFGPMYHLPNQEERLKCLRECVRVLKQRGFLAVAYINKFAAFIHDIDVKERVNEAELDNILRGTESLERFYFLTPEEMEGLLQGLSVQKVKHVGVDGVSYLLGGTLNSLSDAEFERFLKYHYQICEESSILGYSLHGVYVGRKE